MILSHFFPEYFHLRLIAPHEKPHVHHVRVSINLFSRLCHDPLVVYHSHVTSVLSVTPLLVRWEIERCISAKVA